MNKFRVLTQDNEWVYTQVQVLEDRIVCPILNEEGHQFLKPNLKLRPETLGVLVYEDVYDQPRIYEGDIISAKFYIISAAASEAILLRGIVIQEDEEWIVKSITSYLTQYWREGYSRPLSELSEAKVIGNMHQNPELLEKKE